MGLFSKKKRFVDYTDNIPQQKEISAIPIHNGAFGYPKTKQTSQENSDFFSSMASAASQNTSSSEGYADLSQSIPDSSTGTESVDEKRRKLTRRLLDMTNKIEELSNQIYHLQQRMEVLERKLNVNRFE